MFCNGVNIYKHLFFHGGTCGVLHVPGLSLAASLCPNSASLYWLSQRVRALESSGRLKTATQEKALKIKVASYSMYFVHLVAMYYILV